MRAQVDENHVIEASTRFWEQMVAMKLEPEPVHEKFCVDHQHLLGSIDLTGAWNGRIQIRMSENLARLATSVMLMQPIETIAAADMFDAISEIANIIAGVIKSSLPQPCAMGLPHAAVETCNLCSQLPAPNAIDVAFRHADGKMVVRIWEDA